MDMENIDPAMAQRVWQRVRGEAPPPCSGTALQTLMEEAWEDAHQYRYLSRRHRGKRSALYAQMYRQTMEHIRLLKGICALCDQCKPVLTPVQPRKEPESILLRRSYGRALQRLNWYTSNESDPRYGHLLPPIIRQTRQHTQQLLQLLSHPGVK